jgi:hypothetical protein
MSNFILKHPTNNFQEIIVSQSPASSPTRNPTGTPLVDTGLERIVYIGVLFLFICIILVIGLFSKKIEYALIFAGILAGILIAILFAL